MTRSILINSTEFLSSFVFRTVVFRYCIMHRDRLHASQVPNNRIVCSRNACHFNYPCISARRYSEDEGNQDRKSELHRIAREKYGSNKGADIRSCFSVIS